jgi:hypothetical protein
MEKWGRPGKKLESWPKTGSAGDASWKHCAPEGEKGNKSRIYISTVGPHDHKVTVLAYILLVQNTNL